MDYNELSNDKLFILNKIDIFTYNSMNSQYL